MVPRAADVSNAVSHLTRDTKWLVLHEVFAYTATTKFGIVTLLGLYGASLEGMTRVTVDWNLVYAWIAKHPKHTITGVDFKRSGP